MLVIATRLLFLHLLLLGAIKKSPVQLNLRSIDEHLTNALQSSRFSSLSPGGFAQTTPATRVISTDSTLIESPFWCCDTFDRWALVLLFLELEIFLHDHVIVPCGTGAKAAQWLLQACGCMKHGNRGSMLSL